jgi:hypothetical protein
VLATSPGPKTPNAKYTYTCPVRKRITGNVNIFVPAPSNIVREFLCDEYDGLVSASNGE